MICKIAADVVLLLVKLRLMQYESYYEFSRLFSHHIQHSFKKTVKNGNCN